MDEQRIATLQQYLQDDPNDPFLYYALAMEYTRGGDDAKTQEYFEILVERFPEYVGTYYHFGKLLEKLGDTERAIDLYREGLHQATNQREHNAARELKEALNEAIGYEGS